MRHITHPANLALLAIILSPASCSKPPAAPEPQKPPPATSPAPATARTPSPPSTQQAAPSPIDQSIATNVGDPAKFRELMTTLQQAVQKHDAASIATLISYPVDVNPHTKKTLHIRTPAAFIANYDNIITPHIADVIARQKYNDLLVNDQGAMYGNGELWIAGICHDKTCTQTDIKIKTIQNTDGTSN